MTGEKNGLLTACPIRNSGFSRKSKVSAFKKSQYQSESEVLLSPLLLIQTTRCTPLKKSRQTLFTFFILYVKTYNLLFYN